MRSVLLSIFMLLALSAFADERGELRLQRISRHYSAMGSYSMTFDVCIGEGSQEGVLMVDGNRSYMKLADTEIFVVDSVRYEVRGATKEIVIDKSEHYEHELLNPLSGFSSLGKEYNIEECEVDGRVAVRMSPKQNKGEVVYIVTAVDGESILGVKYGSGSGTVEVAVKGTRKGADRLPQFEKERYKGFELIDFR